MKLDYKPTPHSDREHSTVPGQGHHRPWLNAARRRTSRWRWRIPRTTLNPPDPADGRQQKRYLNPAAMKLTRKDKDWARTCCVTFPGKGRNRVKLPEMGTTAAVREVGRKREARCADNKGCVNARCVKCEHGAWLHCMRGEESKGGVNGEDQTDKRAAV